jgi:hypothetical protein
MKPGLPEFVLEVLARPAVQEYLVRKRENDLTTYRLAVSTGRVEVFFPLAITNTATVILFNERGKRIAFDVLTIPAGGAA